METAFKELQQTSFLFGNDFGKAIDFDLLAPLPPSLEDVVASSKNIFDQATLWMKQNSGKCLRRSNTVPSSSHGSGKYKCTLGCGQIFVLKEAWKRHEREQCPQKGWICDLPAIVRINETPTCSRCGTKNPDVSHFAQPCTKTRATGPCQDQILSQDRIFYRKERLKAHLLREHPGIPCEAYLNRSHFAIEPDYPPECTRSSCIGYRFKGFDDRINHLAKHLETEAELGSDAISLSEDDNIQPDATSNKVILNEFLEAPQQTYGNNAEMEDSINGDSLYSSFSIERSLRAHSFSTTYITPTVATSHSTIGTSQGEKLGGTSTPEQTAEVRVPTLVERESDDIVLGALESAMACFTRWTVEPVMKIAQGIKQTFFRGEEYTVSIVDKGFEPQLTYCRTSNTCQRHLSQKEDFRP
jgi:hypothetical protein